MFPTAFNIFLESILTDALEDHNGTVSIGGRADYPQPQVRRWNRWTGQKWARTCQFSEISGQNIFKIYTAWRSVLKRQKSWPIVSIQSPPRSQWVGRNLKPSITSCRAYLGAIISEEGSKAETLARVAKPTAAMTSRNISPRSNYCMHWLSSSSCTHANHGHLLQFSKRGFKQLKWDALEDYLAFHTWTTSPTKKSDKPSHSK